MLNKISIAFRQFRLYTVAVVGVIVYWFDNLIVWATATPIHELQDFQMAAPTLIGTSLAAALSIIVKFVIDPVRRDDTDDRD